MKKNPSLGIISYEKFPGWVSIYTKNSLVGWRKVFAGAQPRHREFKCPPRALQTSIEIELC